MKSKILLLSLSFFFVSTEFFGQGLNRNTSDDSKALASGSAKHKINSNYKAVETQTGSDTIADLVEVLRLKLTCDANSYYDEAFVVFDDTDPNEGAVKLMSMYATAPELWSVKNGMNYSISFLGCLDSVTVVPLTVKAGVPGNYTLTASQVESFAPNMEVSLEDRSSGTFINLGISTEYTFQVNVANTMADRFFLHFVDITSDPNKTITSLPDTQVDLPFKVYSTDGIIKITSFLQQKGQIAVYDILGHRVATGRINAGADAQINMKGKTGIYIVSVQSGKASCNTKIVVR